MASKYQQNFKVPDGFPALLKDFTREILRDQPSNIFDFAANYFAAKRHGDASGKLAPGKLAPIDTAAEPRRRSSIKSQPSSRKNTRTQSGGIPTIQEGLQNSASAKGDASVADALYELFVATDTDKSGALDRSEFAAVLRAQRLSLPDRLVNRILAEADNNADGVISYSEFMPTMLDIIMGDNAIAAASNTGTDASSGTDAQPAMLYGLPQGEFEAAVRAACEKADAAGNGSLSKQELKCALQSPELGLARKDVNLLLGRADFDADGAASYAQLVDTSFGVLRERAAEAAARGALAESDEALDQFVLQCFRYFDVDGTGALTPRMARHALVKLSDDTFPLATYQVHALLATAPVDDLGTITYAPFALVVARALRTLVDTAAMRARLEAIGKLSKSGTMQKVASCAGAALEGALTQAFAEADTEESGMLTGREIAGALQELAAATGERPRLEPSVWQSLLATVDPDTTDAIDWRELVTLLTTVFRHIAREQALAQLQRGGAEQNSNDNVQGSSHGGAAGDADAVTEAATDVAGGDEVAQESAETGKEAVATGAQAGGEEGAGGAVSAAEVAVDLASEKEASLDGMVGQSDSGAADDGTDATIAGGSAEDAAADVDAVAVGGGSADDVTNGVDEFNAADTAETETAQAGADAEMSEAATTGAEASADVCEGEQGADAGTVSLDAPDGKGADAADEGGETEPAAADVDAALVGDATEYNATDGADASYAVGAAETEAAPVKGEITSIAADNAETEPAHAEEESEVAAEGEDTPADGAEGAENGGAGAAGLDLFDGEGVIDEVEGAVEAARGSEEA